MKLTETKNTYLGTIMTDGKFPSGNSNHQYFFQTIGNNTTCIVSLYWSKEGKDISRFIMDLPNEIPNILSDDNIIPMYSYVGAFAKISLWKKILNWLTNRISTTPTTSRGFLDVNKRQISVIVPTGNYQSVHVSGIFKTQNINDMKLNKQGIVKYYRIKKLLGIGGLVPTFKYKKGFKPTAKSYRTTLEFGSFEHIWNYNLCYLGIHQPHSDYVYPSCWVCGQNCFLKEHNKRFK